MFMKKIVVIIISYFPSIWNDVFLKKIIYENLM